MEASEVCTRRMFRGNPRRGSGFAQAEFSAPSVLGRAGFETARWCLCHVFEAFVLCVNQVGCLHMYARSFPQSGGAREVQRVRGQYLTLLRVLSGSTMILASSATQQSIQAASILMIWSRKDRNRRLVQLIVLASGAGRMHLLTPADAVGSGVLFQSTSA